MNLDTLIKKEISSVRKDGICHDIDEQCKSICRKLKLQKYPIMVNDYKEIKKEYLRQNLVNTTRYYARLTQQQKPIEVRRNNIPLNIATRTIQDNYALSDFRVVLGEPTITIDVHKQWKHQFNYPTLSYSFIFNIEKSWKSKIYSKGLSFVDNCFVTHLYGTTYVDGLVIHDVYYSTKKLVNCVKLHRGIIMEHKGQKTICNSVKEFNRQINKINFKLNNKTKKLLTEMQESILTAKKLSPETEDFNLYETLKAVL